MGLLAAQFHKEVVSPHCKNKRKECTGGVDKTTSSPTYVRISDLGVDIRTRDVRNTKHKRYPLQRDICWLDNVDLFRKNEKLNIQM